MKQTTFRKRYRPRTVTAGRARWRVIETKGRKGGPTLVMLPGTLGTGEIFWNQIADLPKNVRIVAVTYPPIGDIVRLAKSLATLLDKLGVERASFVGSSLGGFLAQWFAALYPERVQTLFIGNSLLDPAKVNPARRPAEELRKAPPKMHQKIVLGSLASWAEPEPIFAQLKAILRESGEQLISGPELKARVLAVATSGAVPKLAVPLKRIVVIDSKDDPLIPAGTRADMDKVYGGAKFYRFARGGHYPYITRPDRYTRILLRHLPRAA